VTRPRVITLTTDFGTSDPWVGQMKGVILGLCPEAIVVDLTHDVPPHDVNAGAYALACGFAAFPEGTIHVAVVDPGVGTERRRLAVRARGHWFLAPDNGLLTRVVRGAESVAAFSIEEPHYLRASVSATFEGRDVFAPAAAWIARGTDASHLGPAAPEIVMLPDRTPELVEGREVEVPVVAVDRFGNVALDVCGGSFAGRVIVGDVVVETFHRTYAEASAGTPFLLWNSSGFLEIAVREGRASDLLGLAPGAEVRLVPGVL
jgi:S-adenosylmethionine hydrolase